jgi:hypothetical protein
MTLYFYTPVPAYPHILKCQGICTPDNRGWFLAKHPGTIVVEGYQGDRIAADRKGGAL